MLYTFFGTDIKKIREKSGALIKTLQEKRPDASFFRLHQDNFTDSKLGEFLDSIGLFSSKYIVLLDNILTGITDEKRNLNLIDKLDLLKTSEHVWIIVEDDIFGESSGKELSEKQKSQIAEIRHALKLNSNKVEFHELSIGQNKKPSKQINSFIFTDALFSKNKKEAIKALYEIQKSGISAEELHGALWWQTKVLVQVIRKSTKGISPFVIKKSQSFAQNFNQKEIDSLVGRVVDMYHRAHLGEVDLYMEMERLVFGLV